jgi:16S rRNA processing protein RimM
MHDKICVAKIVAAHGIKGQVKLKVFANDLSIYKKFLLKNNEILLLNKIQIKSPDVLIAFVSGINDRNLAETLIGTELFITKDQLPPLPDDEFYYEDLVGIDVIVDNSKIGIVSGVFNFGAGDFCEIELLSGKTATAHLSNCEITDSAIICPAEQLLK